MTNVLCPREGTNNMAYIACTCAHIHWPQDLCQP